MARKGVGGPMEGKRVIESLKFNLTATELREKGEALARHNQALLKIEGDKKNAAATFKMLESQEQMAIEALSLEITQGYIYRETECLVLLSVPRSGMKQIIRPDTSEVVREEPMTAEEMQAGLDFGEGQKPQ